MNRSCCLSTGFGSYFLSRICFSQISLLPFHFHFLFDRITSSRNRLEIYLSYLYLISFCQATCNFLRSRRETSAPSLTTTRAIGCLHHLVFSLLLECQNKPATMVANLTSARVDLVPIAHSVKPPVTPSITSNWRSSTPPLQSTSKPQTPTLPTNTVFRSALPRLTAVPAYSGLQLMPSASAVSRMSSVATSMI